MEEKNAMPIKEIVNALNKSESAIKMKLKRAKAKAKKVYKGSVSPFAIA